MASLITLTTDFGARDSYVAAMKGVVYNLYPEVGLVDLSHDITPHCIIEAALFIAGCAGYFPAGTIHVVIVDPGVGTERLPLVVSAGSYLFVCPDNGVLTLFLQNHPSRETRVIRNPECMLDEISGTFHGRDIFAPAAAKLARGLPFESVGPGISEPRELPIPKASWESPGSIAGEVIHVDRFGNAITNIPRSLLRQSGHEEGSAEVKAAGCTFNGIKQFYGQVPVEEALPIWGSSGFLEIAVNQGRASRKLGMKIGDSVTLRC